MPSASRPVIAALVVAGVLVGGALTYFFVSRNPTSTESADQTSNQTEQPADPSAPKSVMLTPDIIESAKIKIGPVGTAPLGREIAIPALIEANVTQQTTVVARVSGRITRADVEVGQVVQHGQVLAELSSPELGEAQRAYLTARSELQTEDASVARLQRLLDLGAIPRQDVEKARALQDAAAANVDAARARLELMGLTADQLAALNATSALNTTTTVVAPTDGVLMVRNVSPDATVLAGTPLFTVANLASVWASGEVGEGDLGRVHVGNPVTLTTSALLEAKLAGTIGYVDPQVNLETKATKVRADVKNDALALRPGMPADLVIIADEGAPAVVVPRIAVERVDDRRVVFVADPKTPGRFLERTIRVGREVGEMIQVIEGLAAGDTIVTDGTGLVLAQAQR